jgi:hypothetical protein
MGEGMSGYLYFLNKRIQQRNLKVSGRGGEGVDKCHLDVAMLIRHHRKEKKYSN